MFNSLKALIKNCDKNSNPPEMDKKQWILCVVMFLTMFAAISGNATVNICLISIGLILYFYTVFSK
jgi:hypothetical protein